MRRRSPWLLVLVLGAPAPAGASVEIEVLAVTGAPVPGEPGVVFGTSIGWPWINDAGDVAFRAEVSPGIGSRIFGPDGQGGIRPIVRPGDPFPGRPGDTIQDFHVEGLDADGRALVRIEGEFEDLCPPHCGRAEALVSIREDVTTVHVLPGDEAPGIPGASFRDIVYLESVNDAGALAFEAWVEGDGIGAANDQALWRPAPGGGFALVAREGDPAPQAPAGWVFSDFSGIAVDEAGRVAFRALIEPLGDVGPTAEAIYETDDSGIVSEVARGGGQAPGLPAGVLFKMGGQGSERLRGPGRVALSWLLGAGSPAPGVDAGIWGPDAQGRLALIARTGAAAPGLPAGVVFAWVGGFPGLNEAGDVVFEAGVVAPGEATVRGLWRSGAPGGLARVLTAGDPLPGHPGAFLSSTDDLEIDAAGNIAARAFLTGPGVDDATSWAIVWRDASGPLRAVVRKGDALEVAPGDVRTVASLPFQTALGDARQLAFTVTFTDGSSAVLRATVPPPTRWFAVAENPSLGPCVHCDSYVLPLSDLDDVAHALDLIASGGTGPAPIAVAEIAAGADGVNRDVLAPGEPPWSWHVSGFEGFADLTAEIYDGWPAFVESDVPGWIANTQGTPEGPGVVGFWNYTVVAEVPEPGASGALAAVAALLACAGRRAHRARRAGAASAPDALRS